jgi:Fe-S-cluster containining protein
VSRCTGHCCVLFPIPHSLNELQNGRDRFQDGHLLADILVFKGTTGEEYNNGGVRYWFTCSKFDKTTGNCTIYEQRPWMCREFPYGRECEHEDCTEGSLPDVPLQRLLQSARDVSPNYKVGR